MLRPVALLVLLPTVALAKPGSSPGLDKVCERVRAEDTPGEVLAAALQAASRPPPCDRATGRGVCLYGRTFLTVGGDGGKAVVPFEEADPEVEERLAYVFTAFDTQGGDGPRAADVWFEGKPLALGLPADEPIHVEVYLRGTPTTRWTHVAVTHAAGKTFRLEVPAEGEIVKDGATAATLAGVIDWTFDDAAGQDVSSATRIRRNGEVYASTVSTYVPFYTVSVE